MGEDPPAERPSTAADNGEFPLADSLRFRQARAPSQPSTAQAAAASPAHNGANSRASAWHQRGHHPRSPIDSYSFGALYRQIDTRHMVLLLAIVLLLCVIAALLVSAWRNRSVPAVDGIDWTPMPEALVNASPGTLTDLVGSGTATAGSPPTALAIPVVTASPGLRGTFVVTGTSGHGLLLRTAPAIAAPTLGVLDDGTVVDSTDKAVVNDGARDWRQVDTPLGIGWVADAFLISSTRADINATPAVASTTIPRERQTFVVTGTEGAGLFLRAGPTRSAEAYGILPDGTQVEDLGDGLSNDGTRNWRRVGTPIGEGWMADDFLRPAP